MKWFVGIAVLQLALCIATGAGWIGYVFVGVLVIMAVWAAGIDRRYDRDIAKINAVRQLINQTIADSEAGTMTETEFERRAAIIDRELGTSDG